MKIIICILCVFLSITNGARNLDGTGLSAGDKGKAGDNFIQPDGAETITYTRPNARELSNSLLADDPRPDIGFLESTIIPLKSLKKNQHPDKNLNAFAVAFGQFIVHDLSKNRTPLNVSASGLPDLQLPDTDPLCMIIAITSSTTLYYLDCRSTVAANPDTTTTVSTTFRYLFVNGTNWDYFNPPFSVTVTNSNFVKRSGILPLVTALDANGNPFNDVTAFLDLSPIYGNSVTVNNLLRALDGTGHLKTAPDGDLPFFTTGLSNDCGSFDPIVSIPSSGSGDSRVDENMALTAIHTLWFRNHNRIANWLKSENPSWNDTTLFFRARDINIGTFQQQVYTEYIPMVFRDSFISKYLGTYYGYNPNEDPRIASSFDIAFRVAHSQVGLPPYIFDEDCNLIRINGTLGRPDQSRANCIFQTFRLIGGKGIIQSALVQQAQIISGKISDLMRNIAFQAANGQNTARWNIDIETLNIIRGREFKTKNFNGLRDYWTGDSLYDEDGCSRTDPKDPIKCFDLITKNDTVASNLRNIYSHVDQIDAFIGLILEDTGDKKEFGETSSSIILNQFKRTRRADPNWYQIFPYSCDEEDFVYESVDEILEANFDIKNIDNAFENQKQSKFCKKDKEN